MENLRREGFLRKSEGRLKRQKGTAGGGGGGGGKYSIISFWKVIDRHLIST